MATEQGPAERFLLVQIGSRLYSLPLSCVEGVVTLRTDSISTVPYDVSGRIRGIFNHKGIVTVLANCKGLVTQAELTPREELTAVILCSGGKRFAIPVDIAKQVEDEAPGGEVIPLSVERLYAGGIDHADQ